MRAILVAAFACLIAIPAQASTQTERLRQCAKEYRQTSPKHGKDYRAFSRACLRRGSTIVTVRRGDTLWALSKRTYGRGMAYPTIYTANGRAFRDPDHIYPGQVIALPAP